MSGEAVIFSPFMLDMALGVPVIAVATVAWRAAEAYREQRLAEAERRRQEEKARITEWRSFQERQRREMTALGSGRSELERTLQGLRLSAPAAAVQDRSVQAQGFLEDPAAVAARRARLAAIQALLADLPAGLGAEALAPFEGLRREAAGLLARFAQGDAPSEAELNGLHTLAANTLEQQVLWTEQRQEAHARLLAEGEALLDQILHQQALAPEAALADALGTLRQGLVQRLGDDSLRLGDLDALQRAFDPLRRQVEEALERAAALASLSDAMQRHLQALGYAAVEAAQPGRQVWAIPGGERVAVVIQPNLRVAFQMLHERTQAGDGPLDERELSRLRTQEARWCGDLAELVARLRADGFQYQVELERQIPADSVPIVIVEEADALLEEEDRWEAPKHRSLT
jgi:hypothetical protein